MKNPTEFIIKMLFIILITYLIAYVIIDYLTII